ncbi:MAG TPA: hypothetical protein VD768_03325, partial [Sphingomicrobium sp.]|nr:hypothetical protein [Sphingomicrobium sp.]
GGQVMLGDQVITSAGGPLQAAAIEAAKADLDMADLFDTGADAGVELYRPMMEINRFEVTESFAFA